MILAEIADKMPSVAELWNREVSLAAMLVVLSLSNRVVAVCCLAVATLNFWLCLGQAYFEPGFSDSIHRELGPLWVNHSLAGSVLPIALVLIALLVRHPKTKTLESA